MQHWIILAHLTSAALENAAHFATSENYAGIVVTIMNGQFPTSGEATSGELASSRVGNFFDDSTYTIRDYHSYIVDILQSSQKI